MRVPIGSRLSLDVETDREDDTLFLFLTVRTDFGKIPIHASIHVDTIRAIAQWARSTYGGAVYDFMVARKPSLFNPRAARVR